MFERLRNLFGAERKSFDQSAWAALIDIGARTAAGINVSPHKALECQPVKIGVQVRCDTLSILGLHVHKRSDKSRADDNPLYKLLHDRPNAWTSSTSFIGEMERDCIMHGRAYAFANRVNGVIQELIKLDFHSVTADCDQNQEPTYKVALKDGSTRQYSWRDILDVPTLGNLSEIRTAREAIGLTIAMEQHAAKLMGNGARPSGIIKAKGKLSDVAYNRIKNSWRGNHSGENAGGTAILEDGSEFEALTFSSVDLQFQEMRAFQIVEIARALGVPPNLIFDFSRATWANAETASQAYLTFKLIPRAKLWEGALTRLLTDEEQADFYVEFDTNSLVRADIAARFEAYAKAIASRILNPNEARAKENLPPYEGGNEFINPNIQPASDGNKPPAPGERPKPILVAAS